MIRLGVLGGTFDPPHYGHLILAEQARDQLDLERVLWVPAADPPHKRNRAISPITHRLAMLGLALDSNPAFDISHVDVARPGPHYTADTLTRLSTEFPGADLYFLIGSDSLSQLLTWHEPQRVVDQAWLAVMQRPGEPINVVPLEQRIPNLHDRIIPITAPLIEISGADIRARVAAGQTIRYLLPPAVEAYVRVNNLYTASVE